MSSNAMQLEMGWFDEWPAVRRRIDVSEMSASSAMAYARESIDTDRVSFEHRGARTFLLVGE